MPIVPYSARVAVKRRVPYPWEKLRILWHRVERRALHDFVADAPGQDMAEYRALARAMVRIHAYTNPAHLHSELLMVSKFILHDAARLDGVVVEAGCFKGASAAKLSLICAARQRRLVLFDSFEGIPANDETFQRTIDGRTVRFGKGGYAGSLDEVKATISRYGRIDVCEFHKGWFEETMPSFSTPIAAAFVDVDLVSSMTTCMKYLFPLLAKGGAIFTHDGHLSRIIALLEDDGFWERSVGVAKPRMEGLGTTKLVTIFKD